MSSDVKRPVGRPRKEFVVAQTPEEDLREPVYVAEPEIVVPGKVDLTLGSGELEQRYAKWLTVREGLDELKKLRTLTEIASRALNKRLENKGTECYVCRKHLPAGFKVMMQTVIADKATGLQENAFLCSVACVSAFNHYRSGVHGVPDRGMLMTDQQKEATTKGKK